MGNAQPQQKPTTVQLRQAVLALLCSSSIARVDVGDAAGFSAVGPRESVSPLFTSAWCPLHGGGDEE